MPTVTIGLPVYNGEPYLEEALRSILAQTWEDFELVISDNASTDRTGEICADYAGTDHRIRYTRNAENRGAAYNHNRVIELARGSFFKLVSHDDVYAPTFVEKCVTALQDDPSAVLYHSWTTVIDAEGRELARLMTNRHVRTASPRPYQRFTDLVCCVQHRWWPLFGVIRIEALRHTRGFVPYPLVELVVEAELSLLGRFGEVPEYLYLRRLHPRMSSVLLDDPDRYAEWWDPENRSRPNPYRSKRAAGYFSAAWRAPIGSVERGLCFLGIGRRYVPNAFRKLKSRFWRTEPPTAGMSLRPDV